MRAFCLIVLALAFACGAAQAELCAGPDIFAVSPNALRATAAAVKRGSLTVLTLGGAATSGAAAGGAAYSYPMRLEARLRAALPGVAVRMVVEAAPRRSDEEMQARLVAVLDREKPALVLWGPGATSAARGDDLMTFANLVAATTARIREAGTDTILMTVQYAPSMARLLNLYAYRMAVIRTADEAGVPVLDRYEMMRFWNETGVLNLDTVEPADRVRVARKLYDCMAEKLTKGIVDGVR